MNETEKVIDGFLELMKETLEESQKKPFQYVVAYRKTKNDELIGYHLSTFCTLTDDILNAKRYSGDNPYSQINTISKNFRGVINTTEESDGLFSSIHLSTKKNYFDGLLFEDVYLEAVYLDGETPPQKFTFYKIN
jgi:hypothetical protein